MNREIYEKLKKLKPTLKNEFGIHQLALFGSQSRDDFNEKSDIDIVILEMIPKNYSNFIKAKYFLEKKLQKKVDLGFYKSMSLFIKSNIKKDMRYV